MTSKLNHFCMAVFHLITFGLLAHLNKIMMFNVEYTEIQLFIAAIVAIGNFILMIYRASLLFPKPACLDYEDFIP